MKMIPLPMQMRPLMTTFWGESGKYIRVWTGLYAFVDDRSSRYGIRIVRTMQ